MGSKPAVGPDASALLLNHGLPAVLPVFIVGAPSSLIKLIILSSFVFFIVNLVKFL